MKRLSSRWMLLGTTTLAALALSACGGGGGGGNDGGGNTPPPLPPVSDAVPDSALASWVAYTKYAGSLPSDDDKEPLKLDKVTQAPATDIDEPMGL